MAEIVAMLFIIMLFTFLQISNYEKKIWNKYYLNI